LTRNKQSLNSQSCDKTNSLYFAWRLVNNAAFVHNNKNNKMTLQDLLSNIRQTPESVDFNDVMDVIQENYRYQETEFKNGLTETAVVNAANPDFSLLWYILSN